MCGIIALKGKPCSSTMGTIARLLKESQIRGRHATGVSYICKGRIKTLIQPIPVNEFLIKYFEIIKEDLIQEKEISFIAHNRYSTSGIEHNQPIYDEDLSVAFNGVVTQADPSKWKSLFGYDCETTNDAEIIHKLMKQEKQPLLLGKASMTVVALWKDGSVRVYRNGQRPAYYFWDETTSFVASTKDIIVRAIGSEEDLLSYSAIQPGKVYDINLDGIHIKQQINEPVDLQNRNFNAC